MNVKLLSPFTIAYIFFQCDLSVLDNLGPHSSGRLIFPLSEVTNAADSWLEGTRPQ